MIYEEFELTQRYILLLTDKTELMADYPVDQLSIQMRERIVLPLTTIQQYAIAVIRKIENGERNKDIQEALERLVVRCSFGIINAGRNSA
jgi:phosphoenolpyruvate carboxylase